MLNIIGKKTIFEFSKYQLVTLTNFITRTSIIYIFSDYLLLPYNYVFWYSLLYIILQGYFLHKNFVFREQTNSFFKYLFINVLFGLFDFISSSYLFEYLDFYSAAFIFSSVLTTVVRFYAYKNLIFRSKID
jgi:putative flippase GtrA